MKKVIITGGTKGIGLDICKKFSDEKKFQLINISRNNLRSRIFLKNNIRHVKCDVENIVDIKKLIKTIKNKSIDILVCNVGGGRYNKNGMENILDFKRELSKNFFSSINIIYELKKKFKKDAKIICISSIASKNICEAPIAYSTSKSALNSFIESFAKNYKKNKVCITGILPGHIMHTNSVWKKKIKEDKKKIKRMLKENMPLGKFIQSYEIADLVLKISEIRGNSLNGSLINAEGGITTK